MSTSTAKRRNRDLTERRAGEEQVSGPVAFPGRSDPAGEAVGHESYSCPARLWEALPVDG